MPFLYHRTIHFGDTDAAGVVYFANVLSICHEAYEASLACEAIDLRAFFSGQDIAVPIVHAEVDFRQPLFCGEQYLVQLIPNQLSDNKFELNYLFFGSEINENWLSRAKTIHLCINAKTRERQRLPDYLLHWLERYELNQ